ncbi:DUF3606 domain-containing protein [Polaromonas sp.]|uniref:DUF3606 domain-containing protein n=1 Tax=Polaromonas sp. TaxID=1869339 RepID=UPI002D126997|nr:DUF3606 domain-containing protein [Polaromonas sp.]HQS32331.1 DUF3606 domain-containing protein [Polaromonas sp.]HQS91481.1 DUF3606 domain-containing protein [Polaromonas sp.]
MNHPAPQELPQLAGSVNEPIDINREESVNYWSSALGCSEWELRVAVAEVGPASKDVGSELGRCL